MGVLKDYECEFYLKGRYGNFGNNPCIHIKKDNWKRGMKR
jgi:hypothetical protein